MTTKTNNLEVSVYNFTDGGKDFGFYVSIQDRENNCSG